MKLMREIRFSVGSPLTGPVSNSWGGWPAAVGIQPYLTLRAIVSGEPDARTGYLCNIKVIDGLLRERSVPLINKLAAHASGERLLWAVAEDLLPYAPPGTSWHHWELGTTPLLSYQLESGAMDMIYMTQSFEFCASHRLHCPSLSESENREIFGKCNNPNGHGHNYEVEVTLAGEIDRVTGVLMPVSDMEQVVKQRITDRFDHKYLNEDCPEFKDLNPSVEHIARVIWNLLDNQFNPARLHNIRVWETPKTCAEYRGSEDRI